MLNNFLLESVCLSESRLTALLTAELRERLEEVFCWDGGTNSAWTIGIDYRGEEKMDEIRLVNKAKWILISQLSMSEPESHRYIEKQAMDTRRDRTEIAQEVLENYEDMGV